MMKSIVEEKLVSFKELEQKIFNYVCELGREITRLMLESYDVELASSRDTRQYRDKGKRKTTIKAVYGEVEYRRRVYQTTLEDGRIACVYLLDKAMQMDKIGLISANLAEKIAMTVTESPYRATADTISSICGQSISADGVWNVMQRLGERISEEEDYAVKQMDADQTEGKREIQVLFEEMDGVWLNMQDEHHKKMKRQEMKAFTMYEGWDAEKEKQGRSSLVEKTMLAGDTIFQLDRYHIYQEILGKISDKEAQETLRELFDNEKTDGMLKYIQIYADSMESSDEKDKTSQKAMELYRYLNNNREGPLPYNKRGITIPEPQEGILYKGMGIQETQNCTVITLRMKHRRMRWPVRGANNLAKAL